MRADRIIKPGSDGSYPSHTSCAFLFSVLLLLAAGTGFCAQPPARKPLPETVIFDSVDGQLIHVDANDSWLFELTTDVNLPELRISAGTRYPLLPSVTLERLIADVNERALPSYRLSARVTLFGGKNFLLPTYYLPLSRFKDDKGPEDGGQKTQDGGRKTMVPAVPIEPELSIPPEILEQLGKQRPPRGPRRSAEPNETPAPASRERVLVDCVGLIERHPNRFVFLPYALGWNLSRIRYELLPCSVLEQALYLQRLSLDPVRFNVAGLVTRFQGKEYLLLQRAAVVYNYGNFRP